jgi:hypothetical protein
MSNVYPNLSHNLYSFIPNLLCFFVYSLKITLPVNFTITLSTDICSDGKYSSENFECGKSNICRIFHNCHLGLSLFSAVDFHCSQNVNISVL